MLSVTNMTEEQMEERLKKQFPGCDVVVLDLTGGQNHFEVRMAAPQFSGMSRIQQQRAVMAAFSAELASGEVHALTMKTIVKENA